MHLLADSALRAPKAYFRLAGAVSLALIVLAGLPSLWPQTFSMLHPLKIDTDPENMLESHEPVRVFHNDMKRTFGLHDMIVVGVIDTANPQGAFNVRTLTNIYHLVEFAKTLNQEVDGALEGVVSADLIAPSTVDNIEQAGLGAVRFEWLMPRPPQSEEEALDIARKAQRLPFLNGTLVSKDRKAIALYIPITAKDLSYRIASQLKEKIATFDGTERYYITGLPVAQDQFGVEMFIQMAISAPLAMLLIFVLMWAFFKHLRLIAAPMVVAVISVILTMGLLVVTGNTVHIMSSMIPIFIMPIAVLDAVHILSDFFDRYPAYKDRRETLRHVMDELSTPMLYTSLTTSVGFGSLAMTPIPPVQVFGIFVGLGVLIAWALTVTLIPAYIMLMPESALQGFGMKGTGKGDEQQTGAAAASPLTRLLAVAGRISFTHVKLIFGLVAVLGLVSWYGITHIVINDNPVKWFAEGHPIRVADKALNERFAGTYMAYLSLTPSDMSDSAEQAAEQLRQTFSQLPQTVRQAATALLDTTAAQSETRAGLLDDLEAAALDAQDAAESDEAWDGWEDVVLAIGQVRQESEIFKRPDVLRYIERLQADLAASGLVGKSNALPDIVKTVHRELFLGEDDAFRIPDTAAAVAQTLITYQSSHRPQDLWHFVTPDYRNTNLWLQLTSGDNKDMSAVVARVDQFFKDNPPPLELRPQWFGLTYINVIWQEKMVAGMAKAFAGSFIVVLILMTILFRSPLWGLLSMIPLAITILFIYGLIGLIGKDYDMPVAVLSSLSLGLAIDYAIHFLARSRHMRSHYTTWRETSEAMFGTPARAILRNVIVIGVGFLPLLAAPLTPYKTVGFFISAILLLAGAATLILLPALIRVFETWLFKPQVKGG